MIAPIPGGSKYGEPLDGTLPAWPTGVTAPPDTDSPRSALHKAHDDGLDYLRFMLEVSPFRNQGRPPERVARDLGVWWRLLVVASYCAAAALGWWLRGMA